MIFEWDERKRERNLRKHGLDFRDCAAVFARRTVTAMDDRDDYRESRYRTLGLLESKVVSVIHTETGDVVRIISFRKATRREQAIYFEAVQN